MAKIVLGQRPEKFSRTVKFPLLDGSEGVIKCEFKYRTKKEYAEFVDSIAASNGKIEPVDGKLPDYAEIMDKAINQNAEYMQELLIGWDLDGPVNAENLREIADAYPAAATAIMDAYRMGCVEGKLGN